jgi:hypothetical protein
MKCRQLHVLQLVLVCGACSADEGGGIKPEPQAAAQASSTTTTTSGGPTVSGGTGGHDGSGGSGSGGDLPQTYDSAARWLYEHMPGHYDSIDQTSEPPFPARVLGVCQLDAQGIGERVLYLERSPVDSEQPDRQLVLSLEPGEAQYSGVARILRPEDPGTWIGLCEGATGPVAPPGEAAGQEGCSYVLGEVDGIAVDSKDYVDPSCVGVADGDRVKTSIFVTDQIRWRDRVLEGDDLLYDDPPIGDYEFTRIPTQ